MKLLADHSQWYDSIFDGEGAVFHRMAFGRGGLAKRAQLALFDRIGLETPPHGRVRSLAARVASKPFGAPPFARDVSCVVYEDELAHRGQGKRLLPVREAVVTHPDHYATLFVPPVDRAVIYRHVRFGRLGFWIRQVTRGDDWRSNVIDDEEVMSRTLHDEPRPVSRVLFAIDFLPTPFGLLAIDFNTAPELESLGEAKVVERSELRDELVRAASEDPTCLEQL